MLIIQGRINSLKNKQVSKPIQNVCSSKKQSHIVLSSHEYQVNQCVVYEDQEETSKQVCTAHYISIYDNKNYQSTKCVHVQSVKPAMKQSTYHFSQISLCDDKNCQSTKSLFDDKNCESTKSLCDDKELSIYQMCTYMASETSNATI